MPGGSLTGAPGHLVAQPSVEVLATGFTYTEGPVWDTRSERLLFHDIPDDTRYGWSADDGLVIVARPTHKANGMALDTEDRLLVCEQTLNRIVRREHDGTTSVIASTYEGKELNSPNDIAVRGLDGDVYFSDPAYGRIPVYGEDRPQQLDFQGVYRVRATTGELELVATDCAQPNGLCFSPDGRRLYVNDCEVGDIWVYDTDDDGVVSSGRLLREGVGVPCPWEDCLNNTLPSGYVDGMKCDELGNLYVTGVGGIVILDPDGRDLGLIELDEDVANFTWGGADGRELFVCCRGFLGRVAMNVTASTGGRGR
jgi:gluconolactonase